MSLSTRIVQINVHTCRALIFYILQKNYNFFSVVIISVDNQTLTITLKSQFKKKIEYY